MIEGVRVTKLGPCSTIRMDHNTCSYNAVTTDKWLEACVGTALRVHDYPVNLSVRRLTSFLCFCKRLKTEVSKVNTGSTYILVIPFTLAGFNSVRSVPYRRIPICKRQFNFYGKGP